MEKSEKRKKKDKRVGQEKNLRHRRQKTRDKGEK